MVEQELVNVIVHIWDITTNTTVTKIFECTKRLHEESNTTVIDEEELYKWLGKQPYHPNHSVIVAKIYSDTGETFIIDEQDIEYDV